MLKPLFSYSFDCVMCQCKSEYENVSALRHKIRNCIKWGSLSTQSTSSTNQISKNLESLASSIINPLK